MSLARLPPQNFLKTNQTFSPKTLFKISQQELPVFPKELHIPGFNLYETC